MKSASIFLLQLVIAISMFGATDLAVAQAASAPVFSANDGSVTIDASRLISVTELDAPWRVTSNDGPHCADPAFDDSQWALIQPGEDKRLSETHVADIVDGSAWSRLHLHIVNANSPLGLVISTREEIPYEVFSNGRRIMSSKGFFSGSAYTNSSFVVQLKAEQEIVLAVHSNNGRKGFNKFAPIEDVRIGQFQSIANDNDLGRLHRLLASTVADSAIGCFFFAFVPFGFSLFLAQRDHLEYLWLTLFCLTSGLGSILAAAQNGGWIPNTLLVTVGINLFPLADWITCLQFVAELAGVRRRFWVYAIQLSLFVGYLIFNLTVLLGSPTDTGWVALLTLRCVNLSAFALAVGVMLWSAFRRGRRECGYFLFPIILLPLSALGRNLQRAYPQIFGKVWHGTVGEVTFTMYNLGTLLFFAGLVGIVLYRFIRVSRDEEIAASELEAARTVQQLLIPATQPETPGFSVESIYLPARQVGGDFFMLLPAAEGSNTTGLLAVMGDVSGKGLQAAMIVSTIIGALRVLSSRQPGELLAQLNSSLTGRISGFATCCAVLINHDGKMTIGNAGNPSPYIGGEEIPTLPGLPLGMVEGVVYEETEYTLARGEQLTFVSDGVVEATSAAGKKLFGFDRTREISSQPAAAIADAACSFGAGAPQADDITVLTIRLN